MVSHHPLGNIRVTLRLTAATAAAVILASSCAGAQTAPAQPASGVLTYSPSFFTAQRPNTAYDMINRLPAFSFVNTGTSRGFAGNSGNVLIGGGRPAAGAGGRRAGRRRGPAAGGGRGGGGRGG